MDTLRQLNLLASTIPQLFSATAGGHAIDFVLGNDQVTKRSFRPFTPELRQYKRDCISFISNEGASFFNGKQEENRLKEAFAKRWLSIYTDLDIEFWGRLLDYLYQLGTRTNENQFIHKNIKVNIAELAEETEVSLMSEEYYKVLDLVGASPLTCLTIDRNLNIIDLNSIDPETITPPQDYIFYPDFIWQLAESCSEDEILVTSTLRGDIVICWKKRMIASKRKGSWTIYDPETFKNTIHSIVGDYRLGCNLYALLLDLSYKRHGGLIVIDREANMNNYIDIPEDDPLEFLIPQRALNSPSLGPSDKKQILELTSVDGAMVVDSRSKMIISFGRIIHTHADCPRRYGARTTAAYSAALNGAIALKVSSDGDITIYFRTYDTGNEILSISYL